MNSGTDGLRTAIRPATSRRRHAAVQRIGAVRRVVVQRCQMGGAGFTAGSVLVRRHRKELNASAAP